MRQKLFITNPAPINSTSASATSETANASRNLLPPADAPRPPSFKASFTLALDAAKAGARPKIKPVASEIATVNISAHASA